MAEVHPDLEHVSRTERIKWKCYNHKNVLFFGPTQRWKISAFPYGRILRWIAWQMISPEKGSHLQSSQISV